MQILGANPTPHVTGLEELPGKANYFLGHDPTTWRTNIPTYAKVKYQEVYPGVDLIYYGNQRQLEYDFVIAPGADPQVITLAFDGLPPSPLAGEGQDGGRGRSPVHIDDHGDLILHTEGGEIRLHKPRVYQEVDGVTHEISGGYVLLHPRNSGPATQTVGFHVAAYDPTKSLVIDPVLAYSTYLGGSTSFDEGYSLAVDAAGNAYVTGLTASLDFPTAPGAAQPTNGGDVDAFVAKLNAAGSIHSSTYLGGSSSVDVGTAIAVDAAGNVYVTGNTSSADFPTTPGAFDRSCGTDGNCNRTPTGSVLEDVFVTKLNADLSALLYSTYLGGGSRDVTGQRAGGQAFGGIAVDAAGNAYVTGGTFSNDFPTTADALQPTPRGDAEAFVTVLNSAGSGLLFSTYLGGTANDMGNDIAVDAAGNAYMAGRTSIPFGQGNDFPTTPGAFQTTSRGGRMPLW